MIAFLMFFYFFIFVALFVAIANKKDVAVIYITTKDLTHYPDYDSEDNDKMQIDEGNSNIQYSSDTDELYQIQMKTKTKDEKILYDFHSYLSEREINEVTNIMTVEDDNILWDIKYSSNVYNKFYDSLIEYINENFLSENLLVFLNGEKVETRPIDLIK